MQIVMQYILLNWKQMFILQNYEVKIPWKLTFKDFIYYTNQKTYDVNNQSLSAIVLLIWHKIFF